KSLVTISVDTSKNQFS
nr:immunoglobulin heavy chain junction region [Homo sapiens]